MQFVLLGLKGMFILLGFTTVLIGKYLSSNYILSKKINRKISDKSNYVKGCRITIYSLGLYYIILGVTLLFLKGWPIAFIYFSSIVPAIMIIFISTYWRRHTERLSKST